MTIQEVFASTSPGTAGTAGIGQMQRLIESLQRQIASERQSSSDEQTKAKKIQALQLRIQQLESQMQVKARAQSATEQKN
jgi:predicted RNase H-like nuclease (RuvC/YqgF family)